MVNKPRLSPNMTEEQFDNGYWYALELKAFARDLGIGQATALRKDQLEKAIKAYLRSGLIVVEDHAPVQSGPRDFELGLRLDLPVLNYTNNKVTKNFILEQARKVDPAFTPTGTRYWLNRWREEQLANRKNLTYGGLVQQAVTLYRTKSEPRRMEHGRYINFISDFMAAHPGAKHAAAVRAWAEVKRVDGPKIYPTWKNSKFGVRNKH